MNTPKGNKKKLKLVVSDFHIGSGIYLKDGSRNILEDFQYDDAFITFLNHHCSGEYYDAEVELIINGDFFNLLQINYKGVYTHLITERIVLEGLRQSIDGHREVFLALKRFGKAPNHKVTYVIGNHDMGMLFTKARKYFSEILDCEVTFYETNYDFDGIRVEHGHMHEWNCKFDLNRYFVTRNLPEPVLNLPWGSAFVAECLPKIKMERPYVDKVRPFQQMSRWILLNDFWAGFRIGFKILMYFIESLFFAAGRKYFTWKGTIGLLKTLSVYPNFEQEARKVLESNSEIHSLIMGHTHVLMYRRYPEGKEYYNIGTWNEATSLAIGNLGTHAMMPYAIIHYPELPEGVEPGTVHDKTLLRPQIRLKEWKGFWRPDVDAAI